MAPLGLASGYPAADLEAVWRPLQEKLAALAPDSRLIVAEQSGHFIPGDQPDLVIDRDPPGSRGGTRPEHLADRICRCLLERRSGDAGLDHGCHAVDAAAR